MSTLTSFVHELTDTRVRALFFYWDQKRRGRSIPSRADIDPIEIPGLLPNILLIEVERHPYRFRYRLAGTAMTRLREGRQTRELTGRYIDEVDFVSPELRNQEAFLIEIVESGRPRQAAVRYFYDDGKAGTFWNICLPLSSDAATVNMILVGHFLAEDARRA